MALTILTISFFGLLVLGVPVAYIPHGKADAILSELGLDGPGVAAEVRGLVDRLVR